MKQKNEIRFALIGNKPALDFANTVHARRQNVDALRSPSDLFDLMALLELFPTEVIDRYRELAAKALDGGQDLFDRAIELRRAMRRWLETAPTPPSREDPLVEHVNRILTVGASRDVLQSEPVGWVFKSTPLEENLLSALQPIVKSIAEIIAEGPSAPVRKCGNPRCPLYFYDTSRNQKRRWCSMASCGNQAKVRAHLERHGQGHVH